MEIVYLREHFFIDYDDNYNDTPLTKTMIELIDAHFDGIEAEVAAEAAGVMIATAG